MSDLIDRQDAIDAVHYYIESGYKCDIFQELKDLPSAESERKTFHVIDKKTGKIFAIFKRYFVILSHARRYFRSKILKLIWYFMRLFVPLHHYDRQLNRRGSPSWKN